MIQISEACLKKVETKYIEGRIILEQFCCPCTNSRLLVVAHTRGRF